MAAFRGKPPRGKAGEMSRRTERLRPPIVLCPGQVAEARRLRRQGAEPEQIATSLDVAIEEVEKALVQMRSPRPETTRGTLNVTLAAHKVFLAERIGDELLWKTVDRVVDELLQLRANKAASTTRSGLRAAKGARQSAPAVLNRCLSAAANSLRPPGWRWVAARCHRCAIGGRDHRPSPRPLKS